MEQVSETLTVFFEPPFWVGVFERTEGGRLSVCKVTFGAKPRDNEVYEFILKNYWRLSFSPSVAAKLKAPVTNPKRIQREIRRRLSDSGVGTKSQQALKLQQEQNKLERKTVSREKRLAEQERRFELKSRKRKEKHKGR